jgi:hypothetical protein
MPKLSSAKLSLSTAMTLSSFYIYGILGSKFVMTLWEDNYMKLKWYLQTWFIALLAALWAQFYGVTLLIAVVLLVLQNKEHKLLADKYGDVEAMDIYIKEKKDESDQITQQARVRAEEITQEAQDEAINLIDPAKKEAEELKSLIASLKEEEKDLKTEIELLSQVAVIEAIDLSPYDGLTSEECKDKLAVLRIKQKDLIKAEQALVVTSGDPKKVLNNNIKQLLRCFNSECNSIINNVSVKNIDTSRSRIKKSFEALNTIFATDAVALSHDYLEMKLEELSLVYAAELKKEEEREIQRAIREQMIEEEKVRKEIEREKAKIEKEETQFKNEISKLMNYLQKSRDEIQTQLYVDKIRELEGKLQLLEKDKENVLQKEQNTRAGFVYIISNIGSFGENIYKIGMTRRLEPMDRINELGDASVPFKFDVHAMIFSEDAPTLEATLHQSFKQHELNKVNARKEFFKLPLEEIKTVVMENHNATVTFVIEPVAEEYRRSLQLSKAI